MVPVAAVNHVFVAQPRVAARDLRRHVGRFDFADLIAGMNRDGSLQGHGFKVRSQSSLAERVEILSGRGQKLRSLLGGDGDRGGNAVVRVAVADNHRFAGEKSSHGGECRIHAARRKERDHGGRSVCERDIGLRGRAAVVGKLRTQEHLWIKPGWVPGIGKGRVSGEDHDGLAFHVHILVIVPLIFRRDDPIAHEDHRRVRNVDGGLRHRGRDAVIDARREREAGSARLHRDLARGRDPPQRNRLQPGAVRIARRQLHGAALGDDVIEGLLLARASRRAAFVFIGGKDADVFQDAFRGDCVRSAGRESRCVGPETGA
jgi:hypothetical protein